MDNPSPVNLGPVLSLLLLAAALALLPLGWWWSRHRHASPAARLRALTLLTLFLTFDLVLFGAFTRLTDSGLGCPDWPGCYGHASPLGATHNIHAEQSVRPTGPVTHGKAWVEMVHRYLAATVGALILVMAVASWVAHRRERLVVSPWWATATLVWVCLQGAFGALTVTMKLYPAIVTLHLLGGIGLLAMLAAQSQTFEPTPLRLSHGLRRAVWVVAGLSILQVALGGWVSSNYAVLACSDFPTCQGSWWPAMDFRAAFALHRELGETAQGDYLPFAALTAVHYMHRLAAYVVLAALAALAWALRSQADPALRRWGAALAVVAAWQLLSGLSNVVLGWPLLAAVAHTGGAAVLISLLAVLLVRVRQSRVPQASQRSSPRAAGLAS
jgi:cytochrome c oxidase assembly protein subunit 15